MTDGKTGPFGTMSWPSFLTGIYLVLLFVGVAAGIFFFWGREDPLHEPQGEVAGELEGGEADGGEAVEDRSALGGLSDEVRLVAIALLFGALGSWIHATASFVKHMGLGDFESCWCWWYVVRPYIGGALGLLFYMVLRAGMVTSMSTPESVSQFGVATFAGLAGLFTEQATLKLKEVFDVVFKTGRGGETGSSSEPPGSGSSPAGPHP